ncbi:MAG: phage tail tape measure C-terminal domain-containing protein [Pseudomonadota bacterium]
MDRQINLTFDASGVAAGLETAGAEIDRIAREEIAPAAALIEDAFSGAAQTIETRLARAAQTGSLSLSSLGRALYRDLRNSVVDNLVRRPLTNALTGAIGGVFGASFGGGRAAGGFVAPGASFLVGERGPEVFTPSASGTVSPSAASGGVTVNIALSGVSDAESFRRSETQIAASLARAVGRGRRNL